MSDVPATLRRAADLCPQMLNHLARVTHDVAATADFYNRIPGMDIASTIMDDHVPAMVDLIRRIKQSRHAPEA